MQFKMNRRTFILPLLLAGFARLGVPFASAENSSKPEAVSVPAQAFSDAADQALLAMNQRAGELKIKGAAVVAFFEGEGITAWSSKMKVVGSMKNPPSGNDHGSNLLSIAYAKATEMAETLKDSGHAGRPPMTGELGWEGGLIAKGKTGYCIAAFSGGPSADDLRVSRTGLEVLTKAL